MYILHQQTIPDIKFSNFSDRIMLAGFALIFVLVEIKMMQEIRRIMEFSADRIRGVRCIICEKYEQEKRAEAEKFTKLQAAEATRAQYEAEAEGIRAKGLAEAEAMEKKADAMAKYGKAAMTEMIIKVLPQMAEAIAKPLESIDKVSIIGGAGDSGMSAISDNVPQVLAKTIESVKETTGFDLTEVMKANTYDAKVNNNINVATDFGEKLAENVTKETVDEMKTAPMAKPSKRRVNVTPENKQ